MEISVREANGIRVVTVDGRLTIGAPCDKLHQELQGLSARGARKIVLNLAAVLQIDSSGISVLVRHAISLARDGGALRLVCSRGRVRDALTVTRLVEAIPTFDSESAALADFA
jgi:anti-anti-sigma factor